MPSAFFLNHFYFLVNSEITVPRQPSSFLPLEDRLLTSVERRLLLSHLPCATSDLKFPEFRDAS
jgi:hypothetical protein